MTSKMIGVSVIAAVVELAQDIAVNGRPVLISNTGAQPLYINPAATATAANGFLVPANTAFPLKFTCTGNLSVISNATGTSVAVIILDI